MNDNSRGFAGGPCDIDIPSIGRKVYISETKGTLNFKVEWQSLDGRCVQKYHETYEQALDHYDGLQNLGRSPKIWGDIGPVENE